MRPGDPWGLLGGHDGKCGHVTLDKALCTLIVSAGDFPPVDRQPKHFERDEHGRHASRPSGRQPGQSERDVKGASSASGAGSSGETLACASLFVFLSVFAPPTSFCRSLLPLQFLDFVLLFPSLPTVWFF